MQLGGDPVVLFVLEISHLLKFDICTLVKHKFCQQLLINPLGPPEALQFPNICTEERKRRRQPSRAEEGENANPSKIRVHVGWK